MCSAFSVHNKIFEMVCTVTSQVAWLQCCFLAMVPPTQGPAGKQHLPPSQAYLVYSDVRVESFGMEGDLDLSLLIGR